MKRNEKGIKSKRNIFYYIDEMQIRRIIRTEIINRKNNELIRKLNSRIIELEKEKELEK